MLNSLLDIVLPQSCPLCKKGGSPEGICATCLDGFKRIDGPLCTLCGLPFISTVPGDHLCGDCTGRKLPFVKARSAIYYFDNARDAIMSFKYHAAFAFKPIFARLISPVLSEFTDIDIVVPVPLHRRRLRTRGFNQALLLAKGVARELGAEIDFLTLKRTRLTRPQVELKGDDRKHNVKNAFHIEDPERFKGKKVLIVDDVYTTGATIIECARVVKKTGAEVYVLTLARTASL